MFHSQASLTLDVVGPDRVDDPVNDGAILEDWGGNGVVVRSYEINDEVRGFRVFADCALDEFDNRLMEVGFDCQIFYASNVVRGIGREGDDVKGCMLVGDEAFR